MKKAKVIFIISIVTCFFSCGKTASPHSLFWEISGNGLKKPSYIYGTYHLAPSYTKDRYKSFDKKLNSSKQVICEIAVKNFLRKDIDSLIETHLYMPEDSSYRDLLSENDYYKLDGLLHEKFGEGMEELAVYAPHALTNMFSSAIMDDFIDADVHISDLIDYYIQRAGTLQAKKIIELESVEEQILLLYSSTCSLTHDARVLLLTLQNEERYIDIQSRLLEYCTTGRLDKMDELWDDDSILFCPVSPCAECEKYKSDFNKNRNEKWLEKLPELMQTPSFIAVGALHLVGEDGILEGLRRMGYTVKPIN